MSKIVIRLPQGRSGGELPAGSTGRDLIEKIGPELAEDVLSFGFSGTEIVDLDSSLLDEDSDQLLIISYCVNSQCRVTSWAWRKIAPWGVAPTVVLPRWYVKNLADRPLPVAVQKMNPRARTIGDLEHFWDSAQPRADISSLKKSLVQCLNGELPPSCLVVIPEGFWVSWLVQSPLPTKIINAVLRTSHRGQAATVGNLMKARGFGIVSLVELMCVLESYPVFSDEIELPAPVGYEPPALLPQL